MTEVNSQLESTRMAIKNAERDVDEEMERTGQSWNVCFRSSIFAVELFLAVAKGHGELTDGKYNQYKQRLDWLRERNKDRLDETKKVDLLTRLNIFNEEIWQQ